MAEEEQDIGTSSSDSFINDSDNDEPSTSGHEQVFTDEDIETLISELLTVESKAAEAQEALEDESLTKVEVEVRQELAQSLDGEALEAAVANEMLALREKWEDELDDLETESAHLLEQLDGAGIELPSLYKWIESQAPNGCRTEAWKNRTHWAGSQVTGDATESIADAEKYLQTHRPVRRHRGKLLEEGASGFLGKRLAPDVDNKETNFDLDWSSFNNICSSSTNNSSFGSIKWASVYLASTPQQAAELGLNFPGVDEVEEIDDLEGSSDNPLLDSAIVTERELYQSEDHKNFKKVKEEDDVNLDRKLLYRLNQKRQRRKRKLKLDVTEAEENDSSNDIANQTLNTDNKTSSDVEMPNQKNNGLCGSKRPSDSVELSGNKKARTANTDSSDVEHVAADGSASSSSMSESENATADEFHCTACDKVANDVYTHPLLKVIVCRNCKYLLEEKLKETDPDCAECFCGWCGKSGDLLSCRSCKNLFCTSCIKKNLGEECLIEAQDSGWKCCCCSPVILQSLTSQLEKAFISRSESSSSSDSDSDDSDDADDGFKVPISKRRRKKKIRRILDDAELGEDTKKKIAIEKERQERLKSLEAERLKSLSSMKTNNANFIATVSEGATVHMLGDAQTGYIVNVVREEKEEAIRLPHSISTKLKSHQVAGIRFMWENIIQSITKVRSGDKGLGCILAHTMGLGKTLQVIAFLYAAMRSVDIGLKAAMIVTPVNVLHNWRHEFTKWRPTEFKPLRVYMLEDVPRDRRLDLLMKWKVKGGIFLIGYTNFRNLSLGKHVKDRHMAKEFCRTLQDGPDILVCDEAHMIKNTRADTTQALKQVKCQRRIALTGSPLQNNLMEYFCMVDFVREGFLGSSQEFRNRFQNPIENGQHTNSTSDDVKIMNQRSHILYEQLKGFVQRMDMNVVKKDLPPKTVFVIAVKLSPVQRVLYKRFLDVHGLTEERTSNEKTRKSFFASYQALAQIWNHPGILQLMKDKGFRKRENVVENFLEESSTDDNLDYTMGNGGRGTTMNILLVSQHAHGHLNPTIQLAKNFILAGARATVATTISGFKKLKSLPSIHGLSFASFSDGHDDDITAAKIPGYVQDLKHVGSESLGCLIQTMSENGDQVNLVVYTLFLPWVGLVARKLNVPSAILLIQTATSFSIYNRFCNKRDGIFVVNKDIDTLMSLTLPGLPLFQWSDFPTFALPNNPYFSDMVSVIQDHLEFLEEESNSYVLVNTLDGLELDSVKSIPNAISIGPLVSTSLSGDCDSYFQWLDSKTDYSVVYVSFGSVALMTKTQKEEFLHGLIESGRPFLLVLRDASEDEDAKIKELKEKLGEKGLIVEWCSQMEVLRHRAIGCFVTHCGWNSMLESMVAGVALVGCPQFADQTTNAKMMEEVWGTGVRARTEEAMVVGRDEIKRCLEVVMDGGVRAVEIKKNVVKWKNMAYESMKDYGYSQTNLKLFLNNIG